MVPCVGIRRHSRELRIDGEGFGKHCSYRFSGETELYDALFDMKLSDINEYNDINLPPDMVFVNRTLGGLFGNLCRLGPEGRWREVLAPYAETPTTLA